VGQRGLFTESDLQGVLVEVTKRALDINALSKAKVKKLFQEALLKKRGYNTLGDLDTFASLDDRTVEKYMNIMKITEKQGKVKPVSRKEPFLNIRNAISKAAGLLALSEEVPQELMFSDNEVGVF
jgi:hypothetical protein